MISGDHLWILALALVLDAILGDPHWLWRRLPHPVVAFGWLIARLDQGLNLERWSANARKLAGTLALVIIVAVAWAIGWALETVLNPDAYGVAGPIMVVIVAIMLAGRSLYDHVAAVATAFEASGVEAARAKVSEVVGRDPDTLDETGLSRAAIESLAENFSDGLVAPAFWFAILGLPGLLAYKAINTADSMIGHRSERHRDFGWASARLDDVVNWVPARLSALAIAVAAAFSNAALDKAFRCAVNDAGKHRSPNAGWPEAAMAGALGISLSGPRVYGGKASDEPFLNPPGEAPKIGDVRRAQRVYLGAWVLVLLAVFVLSMGFL